MRKYLLLPALLLSLNLGAIDNTATTKTPQAGEFVWNELASTNVQASKDFYGKVFGWEFVDHKMDDMTYTIVKKGDKDIGGIWAIPTAQQSQIPSHWLAYILVDNVEKALEKATQNGATLIKPVQKAGDMGIFAIIKDPTGAHLALWQSLKK
jgi:predicted enzyme related to lactoylglutathione lyase